MSDPLPEVRNRNLQALFDELPDSAQAAEAAESADDRHSARLRLRAARLLGPRGCTRLASLATSRDNPTLTRIEALELLAGDHPDHAETSATLQRLATDQGDPLFARALVIAGSLGIDLPAGDGAGRLSLVGPAEGGELALTGEGGGVSLGDQNASDATVTRVAKDEDRQA